jgi:hypothetical protein
MKFHETSLNGRDRQTDGHDENNSRFLQLYKRA